MLRPDEALAIVIASVNDLSDRPQEIITPSDELADLGFDMPRHLQTLTTRILSNLRSQKLRIDRSHISTITPKWRVGEVADVLAIYALPGSEDYDPEEEAGEQDTREPKPETSLED